MEIENTSDTQLLSLPDIADYEILGKVGEGTFGEVYKAVNVKSQQIVAIKKLVLKKNISDFSSRNLREMKLLKFLKHENIINLIKVCCSKGTPENDYKIIYYLVFDYCHHDLSSLLNNHGFNIGLVEIKNILKQLLQGVSFIHLQNILHRDIKTSNILFTRTGILKVADFGLAKKIDPDKDERHTNKVVTLWYRSPELLLGDRLYGPSVDMWSVGCVMGELFKRAPMIRGETEQMQLFMISNLIDPICPYVWPSVVKLQLFGKIDLPKYSERRLQIKYKILINDAPTFDLLEKLLTLDPTKRISAEASLKHDIFVKDPLPVADLTKVMTDLENMYTVFTPSDRIYLGNTRINPEVDIVEAETIVGVEESEVSMLTFNLPTGTQQVPPVTITAPLSSLTESTRPLRTRVFRPEVKYTLAPSSTQNPVTTVSSSDRPISFPNRYGDQEGTATETGESYNEDNDLNIS